MARYLKGSLNNSWDKFGDTPTLPRRSVDSYFGKMTDARLREYIESVSGQLELRPDMFMRSNLRQAQAELDRRELVVEVA